MQTIFLATDKSTGEAWMYSKSPISCEGDFCAGAESRCRKWFFRNDAPPPGECREYRLVPVGEADDKDARIAELEKAVAERDNQLSLARGDCEVLRKAVAERSPGVMPAPVRELVEFVKRDAEDLVGPVMLAESVERIYAQPEGHEWQPVDAEHPITAEDAGRMFCWGPTRIEHVFGNGPKFQAAIEGRYILRPVAPPFVFDGTDGQYRAELDNGRKFVWQVGRINGNLVALTSANCWIPLEADGTFAGGRIVRRVG